MERVQALVDAQYRRMQAVDEFVLPGQLEAVCTDWARWLSGFLGGEVVGYADLDNPGTLLGESGGHDFLLIQGRWIVDGWAYEIYDLPVVHDLADPGQAEEIRRLYGDPKTWEPPSQNEHALRVRRRYVAGKTKVSMDVDWSAFEPHSFRYAFACTDLREGLVISFLEAHEEEISYRTFAANADLRAVRAAREYWVWNLSRDYHVGFRRGTMPSGAPVYWLVHSAIERVFAPVSLDLAHEERLAVRWARAGRQG